MKWFVRIAAALMTIIGLTLLIAPRIVAPRARAKIEETVTARLGRKFSIGDLHIGFGVVELDAVAIDGGGAEPPLVAPQIRVHVAVAPLFSGRIVVKNIELIAPRIDLRRTQTEDNVTAILEHLKESAPAPDADPTKPKRLTIDAVTIKEASVDIVDDDRGTAHVAMMSAYLPKSGTATVDARELAATLPGSIRAAADELTVAAPVENRRPSAVPSLLIKGGALTPFRGLELTGIEGTIAAPERDAKEAKIDVHGSYGGSKTPLWESHGTIAADLSAATVELVAQRFKLSQLDALLKRRDAGPQILNASDGDADAHFELKLADKKMTFAGSFHLAGLTVAHPMLAPVPVPQLGFDIRTRGSFDLPTRHLILEELAVDYRSVHALLTADVERAGSKKPKVTATFKIQPLPCQTALAAIPSELTPSLQGFQLTGTFSTDLHMAIDFDNLDEPVDLGGLVGIEGCKVVKAPEFASISRLAGTFEQTVEYEPGKWMTFYAGPENPEWAPYNEIAPNLVNSIMTTEDSGFFKHHGFIFSEFRGALRENLRRGYFRLGASSISMQMVKNVLLSREKTLSRKLQELFLTWYLERHLSKERILEIYFNVIEFGPGIYGIGRAAHHYFGKSAKELEPQEAAFFSSILPSPKRRYVQYCYATGVADAKWTAYVHRIMKRMYERGRLTKEDFDRANAAPLKFDRAEAMPEHDCVAYIRKIAGPPPPKIKD